MMTCVAPVSSNGSRDTVLPSLVQRVWEYAMRRVCGACGEEDEDGTACSGGGGGSNIIDI